MFGKKKVKKKPIEIEPVEEIEEEEEIEDEEDFEDEDEFEDEEEEEEIPKKKLKSTQIKNKTSTSQTEEPQVNLTREEVISAIDFNIQRAYNLLQLLK